MKDFLGIIPARYASTRFPGKPLALLRGKPMIQWVYEGASRVLDHLAVATDDRRIQEAVRGFGGRSVLTSNEHRTGTERCAEALHILEEEEGRTFEFVLNVQGDEPLVDAGSLRLLADGLREGNAPVATLIRKESDPVERNDPNRVKVVVDHNRMALYFSRARIPYPRDEGFAAPVYIHLGLYGYRADTLKELVSLPEPPLEQAEALEQLRWLYHGFRIQTCVSAHVSQGVDTPEDLAMLEKFLQENPRYRE
ncbi:MAG: 3-deoxy-manno-octulosonate cytidylyltransferase [Bacteroidales bacterium]